MKKTEKVESSENIKQTAKVPRILLEILVAGEESQKKQIKSLLDSIQSQMNKARRNKNKVRVLWYIDNGEKSQEEKNAWLVENANCKYYVLLKHDSKIDSSYISNLLKKIRSFEQSFASMKAANIRVKGMKETSKNSSIDDAVVVEEKTNN